MTKKRVPYCDVRAVLHSYVFLIVFPITFILMKHRMAKIAEFSHYRSHIIGLYILSAYSSFTATLSPKLCLSFFSLTWIVSEFFFSPESCPSVFLTWIVSEWPKLRTLDEVSDSRLWRRSSISGWRQISSFDLGNLLLVTWCKINIIICNQRDSWDSYIHSKSGSSWS